MNYVHCDYCDTSISVHRERTDWVSLKITVATIPEHSHSERTTFMDFCPACAPRLGDLPMVVKRGASEARFEDEHD